MRKKCVIFDMDGVLLNSEAVSDKLWKKTFSDNGYVFTEAQRKSLIGLSIDSTRKLFKETFNEDCFDKLHNYWLNLYLNHISTTGIEVKDGIYNVINELKKRGFLVAVASSTHSHKAQKLLKKVNLYELFDCHMFGDMVEVSKPNPTIYLKVLEFLKIDRHEALIFEDSYPGVKGANNAKIDVVWVEDQYDLEKHEDVHYLFKVRSFSSSLSEILNFLCT